MNEIVPIKSIKLIVGGDKFFNYPSGICLHHESNLFYIADMHNHRICWVKADGTAGPLTNIVAGSNYCSSLERPLAVWVTKQGTLFTSDASHNMIFCKTPKEDVWRPIHVAWTFSFNLPGGVAVDASRNVYTNDFMNNRLVQITPEGKLKVLLDSTGDLSKPYGIFYKNNKLYYTDTGNARIGYIDLEDGQVHIVNYQAENQKLNAPTAITLDEQGNIYICEQRSMYFLDIQKNTLSLIVNQDIWKEQMNRYIIQDRICHIGAATIKNKGEIYWVDTIKGNVYLMILDIS